MYLYKSNDYGYYLTDEYFETAYKFGGCGYPETCAHCNVFPYELNLSVYEVYPDFFYRNGYDEFIGVAYDSDACFDLIIQSGGDFRDLFNLIKNSTYSSLAVSEEELDESDDEWEEEDD